MYNEAIRDCDKCLNSEPGNVKAMLRKCDALIATNCKNEAYKLYSEILKIDPENAVAKKASKNMSIRYVIQLDSTNLKSQPEMSSCSCLLLSSFQRKAKESTIFLFFFSFSIQRSPE